MLLPPTNGINQAFTIFILTCSTILLIKIPSIKGIRVLGLFPHPGISHFHFFHPIMHGLAEDGNNVTVISYFPDDKNQLPNYKDHKIIGMESLTNAVDLDWFSARNKYIGHFLEFFLLKMWGEQSCRAALQLPAIQKIIKRAIKHPEKKEFDLIIVEQFNSDCMMSIAWKLQIPVIGMSSCAMMPWHYDRFGMPTIASYIPALFMGLSDEMTYTQRLTNWIAMHGMNFLYKNLVNPAIDRIIQEELGNDYPPVGELTKLTNLMFVNQHYSLSGSKPLPPSVIEVGGIHIQEPKPLSKELQEFLDKAEHGVIIVSWGSMIRATTLPLEKREGLLQAFSQFKQKFIWKWENETLPNQPSNVYIHKWLPQRDILCHPNVRVFITHGGLLGSSETAYCGVPTVITPMYGDQFLNAAALVSRKMGKIVQFEDITKDAIADAIRFALDPITREHARRVSYSYRNRIQSPKETAIWWAKHVAITGGIPLTKSHATLLPTIAYYSWDVYATLLILITICTASWIWVIKRFCCRGSSSKKDESKLSNKSVEKLKSN